MDLATKSETMFEKLHATIEDRTVEIAVVTAVMICGFFVAKSV